MDITRDMTEEEKRKRVVLALVLSSYLVVGIDGSLVITAIAEIASDLHLGDMAMSWVQNAYVLAFGEEKPKNLLSCLIRPRCLR